MTWRRVSSALSVRACSPSWNRPYHGDDDRVRRDADPLVGCQLAGDQLVHDSLGPAVLEEGLAHPLLAVPEVGSQVLTERFQVAVDELDVEELLARAARGERDRLGVAAADLVEDVHGLQRGVLEAGVQGGRAQLGAHA
jgi:hypothetical protein